jgi:hypothetical protein
MHDKYGLQDVASHRTTKDYDLDDILNTACLWTLPAQKLHYGGDTHRTCPDELVVHRIGRAPPDERKDVAPRGEGRRAAAPMVEDPDPVLTSQEEKEEAPEPVEPVPKPDEDDESEFEEP